MVSQRKFIVTCFLLMLAVFSVNSHAESLEKAIEAFDFEEYQNAAKWLIPWAEQGKAEAQYRMGILYEEGKAVKQNTAQALKWYRAAAKQGHVGAKRRLQSLEKTIANTSGNESVALNWYQELASEGDVNAQYNLGFMYETGWGVPIDEIEAARWYEPAAENKNVQAQLRLGMLYLDGAGVAQSNIQGEKWISTAAKKGNHLAATIKDKLLNSNPELQIDVKQVVHEVRSVSAKNEKKAESIIMEAVQTAQAKLEAEKARKEALLAKLKNIQSATNQQVVSDDNALLGPHGEKTFRWYKNKAEKGVASAQFHVAKMYEAGTDVAMNMSEAVRWYTSAADAGYSDAQYYLGMLYEKGIAVHQDSDKAIALLQAAAKQGHKQAKEILTKTADGKFLDDKESVAIWWLTQAARRGVASAQYSLGYMYEHGRGVVKNPTIAVKWYKMAAAQGYSEPITTVRPHIDENQIDKNRNKIVENIPLTTKTPTLPDNKIPASLDKPSPTNLPLTIEKNNQGKLQDKRNKSSWYVMIILVLSIPIIGFIIVVKREKAKLAQQNIKQIT